MHIRHDVVCPTLIGRDPEVGAARALIERAWEARGQAALIVAKRVSGSRASSAP